MTPNESDDFSMLSNAENAAEYLAFRSMTREQFYRFILIRYNRKPLEDTNGD